MSDAPKDPDRKDADSTAVVRDTAEAQAAARERAIKQLAQVVCICKGINLARVLKGLDGSTSVADVNRKVGTGSGGCAGERCGPRIKALLQKKQAKSSDPDEIA